MEGTFERSTILPSEIIFEIFLRVLVRSLLKFRCVSKTWFSLLSAPLLSKTHVDFCLKDPKLTDYRLAVVGLVPGRYNLPFYNMGFENSCFNVAMHSCPTKSLAFLTRILGSYDGSICLTNHLFTLMLLNPCTGKFDVFPDSMLRNNGGGDGCYIQCGFGCDASVDDYKVVKVFSFHEIEGRYENMVKVCSSKAKSWKVIEGFKSSSLNGKLGVYVTGALHWES